MAAVPNLHARNASEGHFAWGNNNDAKIPLSQSCIDKVNAHVVLYSYNLSLPCRTSAEIWQHSGKDCSGADTWFDHGSIS